MSLAPQDSGVVQIAVDLAVNDAPRHAEDSGATRQTGRLPGRLDGALALLSQVALEAIRVAHAKPLDDRCPDCGAGGMGALRDALTRALGPGYTKLVWGNDMNVDSEAWDEALEKQAGGQK